jgi:predicted AAA+ superfamily ATPase
MDKLFEYSNTRIRSVNTEFKRYLWDHINWNSRLNIITGARGVGKTTMLLQYININLQQNPDEVLYVSLDDLYFSTTSLVNLADEFMKMGGTQLFIDEVHKYKNWSQEVKNIYDYFPELHLTLTGSSALDVLEGKADLSRRALLYEMKGLSFREYMYLKYNHQFSPLKLEEILNHPNDFVADILQRIKPLRLFEKYLSTGYILFSSRVRMNTTSGCNKRSIIFLKLIWHLWPIWIIMRS